MMGQVKAAIASAALMLAAPACSATPVAPREDAILSPDPGARAVAAEAILTRPERVNPFAYAGLVQWLWGEGRREQAAFWFYVFQARTRPWADADPNGLGALRASLNDGLGTTVNGWIAGDVPAYRRIVERALAYEARLPLSDARPDGIAAEAWRRQVAAARADYAAAARQMLGSIDPAEFAARRRENGLPNGPLPEPGPPIPDAWR